MLKFPPRVIHVGQRPSQEEVPALVGRALLNLRVPKTAGKLMRFYASQASGFRPSLKMIEDETGVGAKYVSEARQVLSKYGLLGYDGNQIVIDWVRLCAFAAMDPKMMGKKKAWKLSPVDASTVGECKKPVHNYREREFSAGDKLWLKRYEATAQAVADDVKFPELKDVDSEFSSKCYRIVNSDLHNYRGTSFPAEWFDPFDQPDPPWVYQQPVVDGNGRTIGFAHYNRSLPF